MLLSTLLPVLLAAPPELAPGARHDAAIPTLKAVVGHESGEEITAPDQMLLYLKALTAAAPDRTRLVQYATSWEGRPLHALAVGSPERMAKLDATKADLRRLADPRALSPAEVERLVKELPVVTYLAHGVHGNEISSGDAALYEAYHLLAAQGDADVDLVRLESIVLIDPMQNPDGRARFLLQNRLGRAATPDAEPASAEHDEPWPGGRSNHYLFDLNRDWFAQTQPESAGRVRFYLEWLPHVAVDLHEMGGDSTYYFPPPADPANPWRTSRQTEWLSVFGRANAARFDERGFSYFIREVFDSFYPGYGASWPMAQGAIGKTFEMASARGLAFRRRDDTVLTFRDGVVRHFTAALETAVTAARNREKLLRDFADFRRGDPAGPGAREYVLVAGSDPARGERLARTLVAQGIEVRRADEAVTVGTRKLPAGSFLVSMAQPAGRLARNLLEPQAPMSEAFVKEQDRRRRQRLPDQIYDVTAWSLPLFYDVEAVAADRPLAARATPVADGAASQAPALPAAKVAYLLPWGVGTAAAVVEGLSSGLRIRTADRTFTFAGREYPAGAAIVRVSDNGPDLRERIAALAARHGASVVAADSGWVDDGISLGSNLVSALKSPRVLLLWDSPTLSLSAGWTRFVLERRYAQPVTAVRVGSLRRVDLRRFDVIVFPSGSYEGSFNEEALRQIKDWIRAGGTLVTMGESSRWAAREKVGLLDTRTELRNGQPETEPSDKDKEARKDRPSETKEPFDLEKAIQPEKERPELVPGALLRVVLDPEHWLSAGTDGEIQAMVEGQRVFTPIKLDKGRNVGVYAARDRLVASGVAWPESQEQLARKAYLVHQPMGDGHVIAFAEEPNFRAYAEATELLFMNAVLLGPAH
jgi:Zinc carboxypeptidase